MKSKVGKISAILFSVVVIVLSLLIMNVVNAQNISLNISNITGNLVAETFNDTDTVLENLENKTNNETVSDEIQINSSDDWGGDNASDIDETVNDLLQNFTYVISLNQTNETSFDNETSSEDVIEPQNIPDLNEGPVFDIDFEYPEKITRGETITITGMVVANSDVKNVVLEWIVPDEFSVSGSKTKDCGNLAIASSCVSEIDVITDLSTNLGFKEIEIVVSYEE